MAQTFEPRFASAALLTIDVQRDTLDGEPLEIAGTSTAVPRIAALCQAFRDAGRPIVHVVRLYRTDGSNVEPVRRTLATGTTPVLRPATPGRLLAPGVTPDPAVTLDDEALLSGALQPVGPDEVIMYKPRWGAFYGTALQRHLDERGVDTVVVAGCNYPNCPRTTIYQASERDYRVALVEDAVSGLYGRGRDEMRNIGVALADTDTVVTAMHAVAEGRSP